jgi:hypothetical protein
MTSTTSHRRKAGKVAPGALACRRRVVRWLEQQVMEQQMGLGRRDPCGRRSYASPE